jgi:uncharacterized repeat protein (TIGR01451 family)/uncharacterized protein (TIGR03382 family)
MRQQRLLSSLLALATALGAGSAFADPTLRKQVDQHGDFVMFGNTLGFDCATGVGIPAPTLGTVTCPGGQPGSITDSSPDVFWRSDAPMAGQAVANGTITAAQARSTAVLDIPAGATLTYARIYWAGFFTSQMSTDPSVRIERPGTALNELVQADDQFFVNRPGNTRWYQSTADITTLLTQNGEGAYRISEVGSVELPGFQSNDPVVAWAVVAFYSLPSDPPRNLSLFDGLDLVDEGETTQVAINGFVVPNAGFDAKLGVIAYEGEQQYVGDALSFNGTAIGNAVNPIDNFFNSSRSYLGSAVSLAGDLPRLTGGPGSMAGLDMDVVDVKAQLAAGATSATISASSAMNGDSYTLGAFVTSISTFKPDFTTSGKTFVDLNGGALLPGDTIEYSVTVTNTGNDASANTVMNDALPTGISYVPGSIKIGNTALTDATGDDQAEYLAANRTVRARLGTGANAANGGALAINQSVVVKFQVTIDGTTTGSILNQAIVTASGAQGAPTDQYPTDGNGNGVGAPPTETPIDQCGTAADCPADKPVCDTAATPNVCVGCLTDADCKNPTAPQCTAANICGCETDCLDTDQDGIPDSTEVAIGTDPNDADSDDDGVKDGSEPNPSADTDGDNTIDALDPDADNDGLFDGTEMGLPCDGAGTAPGSTHCIADGDSGATTTDPLDPDTDDGGVKDGSEDVDHDGVKDAGETDPTAGHGDDDDQLDDADGDGLTNAEEESLGSNPNDADSDDDGVIDGDEANPADDSDGDGVRNVSDPDSDNDGLPDGTELGLDCGEAATDAAAGHCTPDGDMGATVTSPIDPDTDGGGVTDGNEDRNRNGVQDAGETDPTVGHAADDGTIQDSDGDGLSDGLEDSLGTNPNDADSDDDGVKDGDEPNFADDTDGDGLVNALDPDSDGDGLLDGTELGLDCAAADIDAAAQHCVADADGGATKTNPLQADTDGGGVSDGDEDANHDGAVDDGERDPNDPSDDDATSGGEGGAGGAAAGGAATGATGATGGVVAGTGGVAGSAGSATAGSDSTADDGYLEGGGCDCRTTAPASGQSAPFSAALALAVAGALVRRRRARR